ncbi:MAG: hypothetical protein IKE42_28250 [Aquamicrobium sp.]|nr:hypothetical protein [Aquamicrobium sp.]
MNTGILNLAASLLLMLKEYFTKNAGMNTVSGGLLGSLLTLLMMGLQDTAHMDQLITWLQNQGETGLIAAAVVAGLRTAVFLWSAGRK